MYKYEFLDYRRHTFHLLRIFFTFYFSFNLFIICFVFGSNKKLKIKSSIVPGVYVIGEIFDIPYENMVSYTVVNCNLPKPETDYIKFFYETPDDYNELKSFLPTEIGNPQFVGGYYPGLEKDLNFQYWNHNSSFIHLRNIYTTYSGALVSDKFEFFHLDPNQPWARKHPNGKILNTYDNVISLGNTQLWAFGHWFHDVLAPLTLMPRDVIEISYIICAFDCAVPFETLFAFDVQKWQILILRPGEWVFAKNCYSTLPPPHNRHFGKMMNTVSQKLRSYYNVTNIIPSNYFITNRKKGEKRYISNMYDVYLSIQNFYKNEYNVLFLNDPKEMNEMAYTWASAKLVFVVTGSTCMKSIFLAEKSVMLIALGDFMDNVQPLYAAIHNVFSLTFHVKGLRHFRKWTNFTINLSIAIRVFGIGALCAKNGKWPLNETFRYY